MKTVNSYSEALRKVKELGIPYVDVKGEVLIDWVNAKITGTKPKITENEYFARRRREKKLKAIKLQGGAYLRIIRKAKELGITYSGVETRVLVNWINAKIRGIKPKITEEEYFSKKLKKF